MSITGTYNAAGCQQHLWGPRLSAGRWYTKQQAHAFTALTQTWHTPDKPWRKVDTTMAQPWRNVDTTMAHPGQTLAQR